MLKELGRQVKERQELVLQSYVQIATHFADLHDTPGRMKAKGAIHGIVDWRRSRSFFYWRLRRKLAEFSLIQHIKKMSSHLSESHICKMLRVWYLRSFKERRPSSPESMSTWRHYAGGVIEVPLARLQHNSKVVTIPLRMNQNGLTIVNS